MVGEGFLTDVFMLIMSMQLYQCMINIGDRCASPLRGDYNYKDNLHPPVPIFSCSWTDLWSRNGSLCIVSTDESHLEQMVFFFK